MADDEKVGDAWMSDHMVSVISPSGVVCHFAPKVSYGPHADFAAHFEIPASMFATGADYAEEMKTALGFAVKKFIEMVQSKQPK